MPAALEDDAEVAALAPDPAAESAVVEVPAAAEAAVALVPAAKAAVAPVPAAVVLEWACWSGRPGAGVGVLKKPAPCCTSSTD